MTDNFNPKNSIWPNGSKVDENGYETFYPLGTNKIDVPTTGWPKGAKLVTPFVYDKDNHVVGFCDTKAMTTANGNTNIYLPYELIQADFSSIEKGTLGVYAPNAVVKNALWADGTVSDLPEAQFKYKGCTTVDDVKAVDANYLTTDIVDGVWSEPLWDLEDGNPIKNYQDTGMFYYCTNLKSFSTDLPSLTDGSYMFYLCHELNAFSSDLSSLTDGSYMFYLAALASFTSDLPSLTNGSCMFYQCTALTAFSSDLSSLTDGREMFSRCETLTSFSSDLSNLMNGDSMFYRCRNLTTFSSDLPSLTDSSSMFVNCDSLTSFSSDLSSLTNGRQMFMYCDNLESFTSDLSNLTDGRWMFHGCNLTSFSSDLPSLTDGEWMFSYCEALASFSSDLSSLRFGEKTFYRSGLESFTSDLSSLMDGNNMFSGCKLDTASVQNIADTINTYSGTIDISIGNSEPNEQEKSAFNKMVSKGWTVYVNGSHYIEKPSAGSNPSNIDGEEQQTPIPFWAKPVQATEESAQYVDSEGNYYNILGAQFIYGDNLETYGMFTCKEDAAANMRLTSYTKPIERN